MDDVEKRMEQLRANWVGERDLPCNQMMLSFAYRNAREDIAWLLTQLTEANDWREKFSADYLAQNRQLAASRQECERLRTALMDARRDEGYP